MSDKDRLREELDSWFIEIGVTESGGRKQSSALEVGLQMLEVGHPYPEALQATKDFWQVEDRAPR